ncbi:NUDIX domain-containing protein [Actinoplanes sp. TRM 88003]|uniref:NUDIX domain-containing protein n=1 Tax=Paractinoplanes aksuensis TaxID=2939490 RepID=A0ABT1DY84_9ACTN|nr:NUDIX domain-containing protein [Actinoplanes aksuensis]MCO8275809.1 NUDIX domain-containing protein [Actinoplanes aksuensis]
MIRPIALAVPRRGDDILVFEAHDGSFFRPLGGGIEFGETAEAALRREMREELAVDVEDVRCLGVLENLFHACGRDGHEIVFVFDCRLSDPAVYDRDVVGEVLDDPGTRVLWHPLDSFTADAPLYPAGLADLLTR